MLGSIRLTLLSIFLSTSTAAQSVTTPLEITSGCTGSATNQQSVCLPPGQEAAEPTIVETSKNGSSTFSWSFDPDRKNCVRITLTAVGVGEDCVNLGFTKFCNCKGRGWISLRVTLQPR